MGFSLTQAGPPVEPVGVVEAKVHLEYGTDDKDYWVGSGITAARELAEAYTGRAFVGRSCVATWDTFPPYAEDAWQGCQSVRRTAIRLPLWPVTAVASVKYYDAAGTQQTLVADTDYLTHLSYMPALIYPAPGLSWPVVQSGRLGAVEVTFTAGENVIPPQAKQAILLTLDYWFKNRGGDEDPTAGVPDGLGLPPGAIRLLNSLGRSRVG